MNKYTEEYRKWAATALAVSARIKKAQALPPDKLKAHEKLYKQLCAELVLSVAELADVARVFFEAASDSIEAAMLQSDQHERVLRLVDDWLGTESDGSSPPETVSDESDGEESNHTELSESA